MPLSTPSSENPGSYNSTLWALQNPWFRDFSSLAGALGEQEPEAPTSRSLPTSSSILEGHQGQVHSIPLDGFEGSPGAYTPRVTAQDISQVPLLELDSRSQIFEDGHSWGGVDENSDSDNKYCDFWTVADLCGEVPIFCKVGVCHYWHTDPRQVKRHRDTHFENRYGFLCPNQVTCPSRGGDFRRRDAVGVHCKTSLPCGDALKANGGKIQCWGIPATKEDLRPYDPIFHIPYKSFDGRTGRGGGRAAKIWRC